ncbi:MAG: MutS family DNA mismatch repair protein [Bdellovibrio sp.]
MLNKLRHRENKLQAYVLSWTQKLQKYQSARLLTGLLFCLSLIPLALPQKASWEFSFPTLFLLSFLVFVIRTRRIHRHTRRLQKLLQFTQRQKKRCLGQASGQDGLAVKKWAQEFPLVTDIHLLGEHSLWTVMDETLTEGGKKHLLAWMSVKPLAVSTLQERQNLLRRLRPQAWFYTRMVVSSESESLDVSTLQVEEFLHRPFVAPSFFKLFAANWIVWLLTVAFLFLWSTREGEGFPGWTLAVFPLLSLISIGSVATVFMRGVGLTHHLEALAPLLQALEERTQWNQDLRALCPTIARHRPSRDVGRLETILGFLGTQTNPLLHFLLNVLMPWTVTAAYCLERLRQRQAQSFPEISRELAEWEVWGSLLVFDKYQTQTYAEYSDQAVFAGEGLFHPLLSRDQVVANDFSFPRGKSLGLLTGSNMSGKSTFLRTIGINQILANMGAPVFAKRLQTRPWRLETCIEVSDSLRDGYSYFYAEVRRLKQILQAVSSTEPVLYLIDEIFRGTNNRERHIGSKSVIRTLAQSSNSLGFVSTHDLDLVILEESTPSVLNLHFREEVDSAGQMTFSYHLNYGPCVTTNALRIMRNEGIRIEES